MQQIETRTNIVDINTSVSIVNLNENGINVPAKRRRLSE